MTKILGIINIALLFILKMCIDSVFIYHFLIKHLAICSKDGGTEGDGDGSDKGNCADGKFCYKSMPCSSSCSKTKTEVREIGDGSGPGNCATATDFCYATGDCSGM